MPRVLHVIRDLAPHGAATQVRLLAKSERSAIATLHGPVDDPTATWLRSRFRLDPFALRNLVKTTARVEPAVLQSWDRDSARLCRWAQRVTGAAWVHVFRGDDDPEPWMAGADQTLAAGETLADRIRSPGLDPIVAPNAFDPALAFDRLPGREASRAMLAETGVRVDAQSPVLLIMARIDSAAAINEMAWCADVVRVVCPGLRVLVAGDGRQRMACQRFASQACEAGLFCWLGRRSDLPTLLAAADVVWCGLGGGSGPTPAVEAMAAAKPVVLAQTSGREALLPNSSDGPRCVLPWRDRAGWARTTQQLLGDPVLAARVGAANAERARARHGLAEVSRVHREAAESAIHKKRPAA